MALRGKHIALLAEELFEDLELWYPLYRLREAEAKITVLGTGKDEYRGKRGLTVKARASVEGASAAGFDAIVIPGGYAPDRLRRHESVLDLVRGARERGRLIGFICHGGWVPISAGIVRGRRVTSFPSIRDDLQNAGAEWVNEEVVVDENLVSSRWPDGLPAFCRAIIKWLSDH